MTALALLVSAVISLQPVASEPSPPPPPPPPPDEHATIHVGDTGDRIVRYVQSTEALGFSGAVLAAKDGQVIAAVAVGNADIEGKSPNDPSTLFEIASVTKQFTAAAILRLQQDGKLKLDDTIADLFPGVPDSCAGITIRHLLQHTSGIPGSNSDGAGVDFEKVLPSFLEGGPKHLPGAHFEYWNQGYSILSEVIARKSGKPYTIFCTESIFTPAGMPLTRFTGDNPPAGVTVAIGRSAHGPPRSALDHPYGEYGYQYRGMGGVVTNVWELWRWDRALHAQGDKAILSAESQAQLFKPGLSNYALGWNVTKDPRDKTVQSHGGGVRGFVCEVRRLPDDDGCIFVLANNDSAPVRQVADGVQATLIGKPYAPVDFPGPLSPDLRDALVGQYKDPKGNVLTITAEASTASAKITWAANASWRTTATIGLNADNAPALYEPGATTPLTIKRDDTGAVASVSIGDQLFSRVNK